jgi:surface antigen Omp85-like protein
MRSLKHFSRLLAICLGFFSASAVADEKEGHPDLGLSLPYGFYNQQFGFAAGWVKGRIGYPQPQATVLGTVIVGSEGSAMGFLMAQDLQIPSVDRLFIDPVVSFGYFDDADTYIGGNPKFVGERAGTNDSHEDNFVSGSGFDNFARARFKYLLPIGHGRNQIIPDYEVLDGFLYSGATGGTSWNPLESGRSFIEVRPFYRSQEVDGKFVDGKLRTNGVDLGYFWENRDFPINPSRGNALTVKLSRDFGALNSSESWTVLQAELDAYQDFGENDWFRSQVLALDFWTADTPSWDKNGNNIDHRAPAYTGATLGGLWRMRGYPSQRFNDRSAIYYSAELRLTPRWNPFDSWPVIQEQLGVEWLQFVPFVEVGRVAGSYNLSELHSDMKWDAGIGLRAWVKGFVLRVDTAISNEDFGIQMMIGQPFQF